MISKGIFYRLVSLTTFDDDNHAKTVNQLHPIHAEALKLAGLVKGEFPILSDCIVNDEAALSSDDDPLSTDSKKYNPRSLYLTISYCQCWRFNFIPYLLKRLKKKYNLP